MPSGEIIQLFFLLIYFLGSSPSWQVGWKARPLSAEEEEALHECSVGCLSRQPKLLLCAARLGGAVVLAPCSRLAAGCLLSVQAHLLYWKVNGKHLEAVCVLLLQLLQLTVVPTIAF